MEQLELAEMIKSLRAELVKAQDGGEEEKIKFNVEEIELDLEISAVMEKEATIGAKFYVLTSQVKGNEKNTVTQKIKLKLKPVDQNGDGILISDDDKV